MADNSPDWSLIRTFLAVYKHRSFSGAARELNLTQPTVGRHIEALEAILRTSLFTRSQSGVLPTAPSEFLVSHASTMASAARAFTRASATDPDNPSGIVRISTSEGPAYTVLINILGLMQEKYPQISVELSITPYEADILRRDADIAIRNMRPTQQSIVTRKLFEFDFGLYAHKCYIARYDQPETVEDLKSHKIIGYDINEWDRQLLESLGLSLQRENFWLSTDNHWAQILSVRAGLGIGLIPRPIAVGDPNLVEMLPGQLQPSLRWETWLSMHEDLRRLPHTRAAFDLISETCRVEYLRQPAA